MTVPKNIPPGHQLHVTTWENDADDYHTKILSGLTEEDVKFYISLGKEFESKNTRKGPEGMGNCSADFPRLTKVVKAKLKKFPNISVEVKDIWTNAIKDEH